MDLDFIPDVPSGPLDEFRKQASFNWKEMMVLLEPNVDNLKQKYNIWKKLREDPIFAPDSTSSTLDEQRRKTLIQMYRFNQYNFYCDAKKSTRERMRNISLVEEVLNPFLPNVALKIGIGMFAFSYAINSLGTEKHMKLSEDSFNRKIIGSMGITEVGHGSNTKGLRTTATFDPIHQEFIINTPDFEAAKCWIGNMGKTCTHSVIFAKLYTPDGTNCGLHTFVAPIRDTTTMMPFPGIIVGDMGEKCGLNGTDNGFLMFQNYRVKKECLLNRFGDVTPEGVYELKISDFSKINIAVLETLSLARLGIILQCYLLTSVASVIATRYSAVRKQFGPDETQEIPIIDYQLHQWRIFPYLAAAPLMKISYNEILNIFIDTIESTQTGKKTDDLSERASEFHAILSALKPTQTWLTAQAIQECREACGGHGYLKASRFGDLRNDQDASVTYEGDNNVLGHQCSNWLIGQWKKSLNGTPIAPTLKSVSFLNNFQRISKRKFNAKNINDVMDEEFILSTYEWLVCWLIKTTDAKMEEEVSKGLSKFEARSKSLAYKSSKLYIAFAEYLVLLFSNEYIKRVNGPCKMVLKNLFILYGLSRLDKHLSMFYHGQYANDPMMVELVQNGLLEACARIRPEAISIADALALPDYFLKSVLGNADGNVYQHLQNSFFYNEEAMGKPSWWKDIVKSKI